MELYIYQTKLTKGPYNGELFGRAADDDLEFFKDCICNDPDFYIDQDTFMRIAYRFHIEDILSFQDLELLHSIMQEKHKKYLKENDIGEEGPVFEDHYLCEIEYYLCLYSRDIYKPKRRHQPTMEIEGMEYPVCPRCGSLMVLNQGIYYECEDCEKRW